jgi:ferredoxin/flavodoxin---NADP+ reductase
MSSLPDSFSHVPQAKEDKFYRARIVERKDFSSDLWMIRVDPGAEFRFAPGQYATLGVRSPTKHIERPYSIVSSPYEDFLEFFIDLVPQGDLTPLLYKLQVGDTFTCRRVAKGRFTLDTKTGHKNHLLLATVTGIAPFVSYVRSLQRDSKQSPVQLRLFLIEGASHSWEFGYREEMEQLAAKVPWFIYIPTISRPWEDRDWHGETGRVEDLIRKYTDVWSLDAQNTTAYLCGHPTMIENGKGILHRHGWQKDSLKEEVYFVPAEQSATKRASWWPWRRFGFKHQNAA